MKCRLIQTGLDQRKLFIAAKEWLPKIGYREVRPLYLGLYIDKQLVLTFLSEHILSTVWFQVSMVAR